MVSAVLVPQDVHLRFGPPIDLVGCFGRTRDLAAPTAVLTQALVALGAPPPAAVNAA